MGHSRSIAVVTGTRAEFGLLASVMAAIRERGGLTLRTLVTGTHLTTGTWREVREAGFAIDARVAMQRRGESGRAADVAALGRGVAGLGRALDELRPEVVVVLGDRIEAMAVAVAASVGGRRVAHLHGGDRAEGVADEAMRHAISKLSHLHFAATATSRRRLIRMGEDPSRVWNVGSPAVDALADVEPSLDAKRLIVMQHSIGGDDETERGWMRDTIAAVSSAMTSDRGVLWLAPNGDPGCGGIRAALAEAGIEPVEHLPRAEFLSLLAGSDALVGNSSAGLIEAAALRVPVVNIGPRQAGRERAGNVVDCDYGMPHVVRALHEAVAMDRARLRHPYGKGDTGPRIAEVLATVDLEDVPVRKRNAY